MCRTEAPEGQGLGMWGHPVTSGTALQVVRRADVLCCENCIQSKGRIFLLAILENARELTESAFCGNISVRAPGGRVTYCHYCSGLITTNNRRSDANCVVQGSPWPQKPV